MKKKKKSLTGYTYNGWQEDFRFYDECWYKQMIDTPNIYKRKGGDWTAISRPIKRVRITIEEL